MKEKDKNREIDDVLSSLLQMQRAVPSDHAYDRIMKRITGQASIAKVIPLRTVSFAAASVLILVLLNIFALQHKKDLQPERHKDGVQELVNYYGLTGNPYGI